MAHFAVCQPKGFKHVQATFSPRAVLIIVCVFILSHTKGIG